jgi:zinc/manganese transport system substrate-binding protein
MTSFRRTLCCAALLFSVALISASAATLKIVAAENFYGGIAQQVAGQSATVTSILSNPNQDPHEFTTNAATALAVSDADIVIYSGIGYDTWMEKLLGSTGKPGRTVIDVADLIGAKDGDNPHIWYDPRTMLALAGKLVEVFSKVNPGEAAAYRKQLDDLKAAMQRELARIAEIKAAAKGLTVTATEPVFGYMAEALGLKMINYDFQIKIMNDSEPTADETAAFEESLTSKTAKILFYNDQVTDPTTDRMQKIAKQAGLPLVGVTETQPPDQKSYAAWMLHELDDVQAALPGKNPQNSYEK